MAATSSQRVIMLNYSVRRLLQSIPLLFLLSLILFVLINIVPGGPLAGYGRTRRINPEKIEQLKRQLGLDKSIPVQYVVWLVGNDWMRVDLDGDGIAESFGERRGVLRGDFGFSYRSRQPVLQEIGERLGNTVYLMSITLLAVAVIAIPIGVIAAIKQYSFFDISTTTLSFMGQAIPEFWLGLVLLLVFYAGLDNPWTGESLLPSGGMYSIGADSSIWDRMQHLILPVSMGMVGWIAWYSRFLRSSMLEVIHQDYIRTARAKGQKERIVMVKHALKNALIPLVTLFALDFPYIFTGSIYVELIFSWPGMGRLFYDAAVHRDYPILMGILIISACLIIVCNLAADLAYAYLDPRVRYE